MINGEEKLTCTKKEESEEDVKLMRKSTFGSFLCVCCVVGVLALVVFSSIGSFFVFRFFSPLSFLFDFTQNSSCLVCLSLSLCHARTYLNTLSSSLPLFLLFFAQEW